MNKTEFIDPNEDIPHDIFLSRNYGGDHYVVTVKPNVSSEVSRELTAGLNEFTGLGFWEAYQFELETRLTRHNDVGGDEGLKRVGTHVGEILARHGFSARVVNADNVQRTEYGRYIQRNKQEP